MMGSNDDKNKSTIPSIMVFRPTLDEMKDFSKYIAYMESLGAHKAGLAKVPCHTFRHSFVCFLCIALFTNAREPLIVKYCFKE